MEFKLCAYIAAIPKLIFNKLVYCLAYDYPGSKSTYEQHFYLNCLGADPT